jgi:hypothetical protein
MTVGKYRSMKARGHQLASLLRQARLVADELDTDYFANDAPGWIADAANPDKGAAEDDRTMGMAFADLQTAITVAQQVKSFVDTGGMAQVLSRLATQGAGQ